MTDLSELKQNFEQNWPEIIAREEVPKYTGGLYSANTMAAYDTLGKGVKNRLKVGRKIAYAKADLIDFVIQGLEPVKS